MAKLRTTGKSVVGLDIEPGYVAAAQVSVNGAIAVERAATAPLPAEVMRDGEVADADALAATLKELWSAHKLPRRVRLGVANQRIVVRTIDLPPLSDAKDLAAALRFQAQEHIPMPLEQAVLDYHSLGRVQTPEGERTRVVRVAACRDMVDRLLAAARGAGLRPEGIDLSAFAMIRALDSGTFDEAEGGLLYVNVAGMTNLAIARSTTCLFTRAAQGGT
ncbi:MAG: type IV pilus biogenesis protein PilM [Solirubrobacteraceae bacterium]